MTRSGYSDDWEGTDGELALYRNAVDRSIAGKRGQAFLRELAAAMDAMPEKVLIRDELINKEGECCTIGVVCKVRNLDVEKIDYEDPRAVGAALGIARSMAAEIEYENDEGGYQETPEKRWERMRRWVAKHLKDQAALTKAKGA